MWWATVSWCLFNNKDLYVLRQNLPNNGESTYKTLSKLAYNINFHCLIWGRRKKTILFYYSSLIPSNLSYLNLSIFLLKIFYNFSFGFLEFIYFGKYKSICFKVTWNSLVYFESLFILPQIPQLLGLQIFFVLKCSS